MRLFSFFRRNWTLWLGLLLCIPAVWPYLQPHFFHLHDFTHVARLAEFERGILDGQIPVRWSQNLGFGYGMPQFSFYGPLFYAEALLFRFVGISYIWAIKLTVVLQIVVSFIALYRLGELLWSKSAGFLAGIAGIYAPYRLVDMYVRGAFAELSGMTFFIITLWAIVLWAKQPNWRRAVFVAIGGMGIVTSHTLMALITAPFILLWLGYWVIVKKRLRHYWTHIILIGALTIGLSAFFALPALFEKGYTQADQLTTGFSDYNHHFLYIRQLWQSTWGYGGSVWGIEDNVSFELGKAHLIALAFLLLWVGQIAIKQKRKFPSTIVLFGGLLLLSLFLTILKSKPLWDVLPFMVFIQFPWRFLSISIILLGLLLGSLFSFIPKKMRGLICFVISLLIIFSQLSHIRPEAYLTQDEVLYYSDPARIQTTMSEVIPDFLPKTAEPQTLPSPISSSGRFIIPTGIAYSIEVNRSHEFLIGLNGHESFVFTANIFDFPGWTLYYDGRKLNHSTPPHGLIQATIPAGDQESFISGRFEETPIRLVADMLTLTSILVIIMLIFKERKMGKRT